MGQKLRYLSECTFWIVPYLSGFMFQIFWNNGILIYQAHVQIFRLNDATVETVKKNISKISKLFTNIYTYCGKKIIYKNIYKTMQGYLMS